METTRRLVRIDPVKSAGVAALLAIIGSLLWLPAAFMWRAKMVADPGYQQMVEQFGHAGMGEIPGWLIAISPLTNGGIALVSTLVTLLIVNAILKRIGGIPYTVAGE